MIADPDGSGNQIANYQMVAIATSRDRTLQAGKLFLINLNGSEAHSTATDLTPLIPGDRTASQAGVGRYYDAEPLGQSAAGRFLVSWSDGPVESETLALAGTNAQFGIYVFDSNSKTRFPIFDDPTMWDVLPRPLRARQEPSQDAGDAGVAAQRGGHDDRRAERLRLVAGDIKANLTPGSVVKVRLLEGFSGEEGGVDMFGTTEFDGQSKYGEIPVQADNSFAAVVPGNVPVPHPADRQVRDEPRERVDLDQRPRRRAALLRRLPREPDQGGHAAAGHPDQRAHGRRQPGAAARAARGRHGVRAVGRLVRPRRTRCSPATTRSRAFPGTWPSSRSSTAKCASCHNGDATARRGEPDLHDHRQRPRACRRRSRSTSRPEGGRHDRRAATGDFTASYLSLMGLGEILGDDRRHLRRRRRPRSYVAAARRRATASSSRC